MSKAIFPRREIQRMTDRELLELIEQYITVGTDWNFYEACVGPGDTRVQGHDLAAVIRKRLMKMPVADGFVA